MKVVVEPEAVEDVETAYDWYWERSQEAAVRFREAFKAAAGRAGDQPLAFQVVEHGLRRVLLDRFPYKLYFHLGEHDGEPAVLVIACFHAKRNPWAVARRVAQTRPR